MPHPLLAPAYVAVVTGGASGIGLAAAKRFAAAGMRVAIADLPGERLDRAAAELAGLAPAGTAAILAVATDMADIEAIRRLEASVLAAFGGVHLLMNNAGVQPGSDIFGPPEHWRRVMDVNLWGVIHTTQTLVPGMIARGEPGLIVNTGSKQGITTPPGDPAYNVAKAGVKVFTEALQHDLRNRESCRLSAHLFIPGFVFTPLTAHGRTEKPAGAWTADQTVDYMLERLAAGDFYILCPDNDVDRRTDQRRILWAAGDIAENRPPLSRWHRDFAAAFQAFLEEP